MLFTSWKCCTVCILIVLLGCTTTDMALQKLSDRYMNRSADDFFIDNGPPMNAYALREGGSIYVWSSGRRQVALPATTTYSGTATPYGSFRGTSQSTGGGTLDLECEVKIVTDRNNNIQSISITQDTWGWWETSRCNEYFE